MPRRVRRPADRDDLQESALTWLRGNLDKGPPMTELARHLNLGERTLRRRPDGLGVSWRELHGQVRRAFKRRTGARPSALRQF